MFSSPTTRQEVVEGWYLIYDRETTRHPENLVYVLHVFATPSGLEHQSWNSTYHFSSRAVIVASESDDWPKYYRWEPITKLKAAFFIRLWGHNVPN